MAYNLYHVQLSRAWAQRIEKENALAEKFWMETAKNRGDMSFADDARSEVRFS